MRTVPAGVAAALLAFGGLRASAQPNLPGDTLRVSVDVRRVDVDSAELANAMQANFAKRHPLTTVVLAPVADTATAGWIRLVVTEHRSAFRVALPSRYEAAVAAWVELPTPTGARASTLVRAEARRANTWGARSERAAVAAARGQVAAAAHAFRDSVQAGQTARVSPLPGAALLVDGSGCQAPPRGVSLPVERGALVLRMAVPPERVVARVAALLAECGLPPTTSAAGVLTVTLAPEATATATYTIQVQAVIAPESLAGDAPTRMALSAVETTEPGSRLAATRAIGPANVGRSGAVWAALRAVTAQLVAEAAPRASVPPDTSALPTHP